MRAWRESASVIVAARLAQKSGQTLPSKTYNYNLLCLRRHQNSRFLPGTYVFPGGEIHPADADLKWQNLFSNFGFDKNNFAALSPSTASVRPNIFHGKPNELPREISLRITAIRETFEECGLLLCKNASKTNALSDWAQHLKVSEQELQNWQMKVHGDATEFYTLCERLKCYPDLWSLYEWSNWMTPSYLTGRRYDTVFYIVCMSSIPDASYEATEMEGLEWNTPTNFLSAQNIVLPPPQEYEIARIAKFEGIDNLLEFAIERSKKGVKLNLPVKVELLDGIVHVMPGDSMYPKDISLADKQVIDKTDLTINEFRDISPVKNRLEFFNFQVKNLLVQNCKSEDGHLSPIPLENVRPVRVNRNK